MMKEARRGKEMGGLMGKGVMALAGLLTAMMAAGCFTSQNPIKKDVKPEPLAPGALGTRENPVKCDSDLGEEEYLLHLRGPDGKRVHYELIGTVPGPKGTELEVYLVQSRDGTVCREVHMSKYYPGKNETRPIEGFTYAK
jgi:hypothetical protein